MVEEEDQLAERNNFESEKAAAGEQEGQEEGQGPEEAEGGLTLESVINNFNTATSSLAADFYYRFSRILQEREETFRVSNKCFTSRVHAQHYTALSIQYGWELQEAQELHDAIQTLKLEESRKVTNACNMVRNLGYVK